jgi:protein-tyrosine kinase
VNSGFASFDSSDTQHMPRPRRELIAAARPAVPGAELLMAHSPGAPRCEKVRALRTELMMRRDTADGADMVALLSPCAGEGRSLLAAELAIAFAQTGQPTLLVDADLRRPRQQVLFGSSTMRGLAEAIEYGNAPSLQAVQGLPQLSVLTAGAVSVNPLELLSDISFTAIVQEWRRNFRFVVIDTAPVMRFSDGLAVANAVGRVLALSRAQHTPYKGMQDMLRRLKATRSHVLGAVISHF